jgi:uncharacterized protein YdaU (DUF1376 family)
VNFYKHYIGDFQRDTGHLSLTQRGAYLCLMHHYYATEKPLPNDHSALCRIAGAIDKAERDAVKVVMGFFSACDSGLMHLRIEAELHKAGTQADTNRRIAHEREEARRAAREAERLANEASTNRATNREPNQTPDTSSEAKASAGKPADDSPKAELWRAAVSVLEAGGCPKAQCRTFMGKLVGDYTFPVVQQAVAAAVTHQPADAREYLKATCQRLKGERVDPVTVPSDAHEKTVAYLAEQAARPRTPPPPEARALTRRTA